MSAPLGIFTCLLPQPQMSNLVGRVIEPGEVVELNPDDVETVLEGTAPETFSEDLAASVREKLDAKGITPARAVELGADGLTKLEGIGKATAEQILEDADGTDVRSVPWLRRATAADVKKWVKELRKRAAEAATDDNPGGDRGLLQRALRLEQLAKNDTGGSDG